ncbi:MAG: hypothetical protein MUF77_13765, partial [Leptospira sp.]|nr:hypothetical protein [Leptospira sp.]
MNFKRISICAISLSFAIACSSSPKKNDGSNDQTSGADTSKSRSLSGVDGKDDKDTKSKKTGCIEGDCVNGIGKYVYDNGDIYSGAFKNDMRHGT